jgi:hypothetical protein
MTTASESRMSVCGRITGYNGFEPVTCENDAQTCPVHFGEVY